jgi:hypothetical protein
MNIQYSTFIISFGKPFCPIENNKHTNLIIYVFYFFTVFVALAGGFVAASDSLSEEPLDEDEASLFTGAYTGTENSE